MLIARCTFTYGVVQSEWNSLVKLRDIIESCSYVKKIENTFSPGLFFIIKLKYFITDSLKFQSVRNIKFVVFPGSPLTVDFAWKQGLCFLLRFYCRIHTDSFTKFFQYYVQIQNFPMQRYIQQILISTAKKQNPL